MYTPGCWWKDVELLEKKTEKGGECGEGLPAPPIEVLEHVFRGGCGGEGELTHTIKCCGGRGVQHTGRPIHEDNRSYSILFPTICDKKEEC